MAEAAAARHISDGGVAGHSCSRRICCTTYVGERLCEHPFQLPEQASTVDSVWPARIGSSGCQHAAVMAAACDQGRLMPPCPINAPLALHAVCHPTSQIVWSTWMQPVPPSGVCACPLELLLNCTAGTNRRTPLAHCMLCLHARVHRMC